MVGADLAHTLRTRPAHAAGRTRLGRARVRVLPGGGGDAPCECPIDFLALRRGKLPLQLLHLSGPAQREDLISGQLASWLACARLSDLRPAAAAGSRRCRRTSLFFCMLSWRIRYLRCPVSACAVIAVVVVLRVGALHWSHWTGVCTVVGVLDVQMVTNNFIICASFVLLQLTARAPPVPSTSWFFAPPRQRRTGLPSGRPGVRDPSCQAQASKLDERA